MKKPRIMFVDDDPMLLAATRRQLARRLGDCELVFCESALRAIEETDKQVPQILFCDSRMPEMDGPTFLSHYAPQYPQTIRFALSGYSEPAELRGMWGSVHRLFSKPIDSQLTCKLIRSLLELRGPLYEQELLVPFLQWLDRSGGARISEGLRPIAGLPPSRTSLHGWLGAHREHARRLMGFVGATLGASDPEAEFQVFVASTDLSLLHSLCLAAQLAELVLDGSSKDSIGDALLHAAYKQAMEVCGVSAAYCETALAKSGVARTAILRFTNLLLLAALANDPLPVEIEQQCDDLLQLTLGAFALSLWGIDLDAQFAMGDD